MAGTWNRTDPTPMSVKKMGPLATGLVAATGTYFAGLVSVRVAVPVSATGAYWSNPEDGTVLASSHMVWTTAGTGTFDMGVSTDGTSGTDDIVNGGTMLVGVYGFGTIAATLVTGVVDAWKLVGPAGTGTKNTVTLIHNESTTGTAVGYIFVQYMRVVA